MSKKPKHSTAEQLNKANKPKKVATPKNTAKSNTQGRKNGCGAFRVAEKVVDAQVQLHLGAREVQGKLQPHVDVLEQELSQAQEKCQQFQDSAEGAWENIEHGVSLSMKAMQQAFDKAKEHFPDEDKK